MKTVIKVQNLQYSSYINKLSFSIKEGEMSVISSSDNKNTSTILSLIAGLIKPDKGKISLSGKSLADSPLNIGYVFNCKHINHLCESLNSIPKSFYFQPGDSDIYFIMINYYLNTFGFVTYKAPKKPDDQRSYRNCMKLINALIITPDILLIDEPFDSNYNEFNLQLAETANHIACQNKKICLFATSQPEILQGFAKKELVV